MREIDDSLELALERIAAFRSIHEGSPRGVTREAVACLEEAVGMGERSRGLLLGHLAENFGPREGGRVFLGVLIGLLTATYEQDRRERPGPASREPEPEKEPLR